MTGRTFLMQLVIRPVTPAVGPEMTSASLVKKTRSYTTEDAWTFVHLDILDLIKNVTVSVYLFHVFFMSQRFMGTPI